jgi:cytochrome b
MRMKIEQTAIRVRVWDLPTRLFHWVLVVLVAVDLYTGFVAPEWWLGVHLWAGYAIVALLVMRLVWAVFGPEYSHIASFAYSPRDVWGYVRGLLLLRPSHHIGHNPAGAVMIYLLFAVLVATTATGLLVLGGEEKLGPFAGIATYSVGNGAKGIHEALVFVLLVLVAGHIVGVIAHGYLTGENLITAMITGDKILPPGTPLPAPRPARLGPAAVTAAAIIGVAALALVALSRLPPTTGRQLALDPVYVNECGACHDPFHPSLLPAASWAALMAGLQDHFGEDASLEPVRAEEIAAWLTTNAAGSWDTEIGNRFRVVDPTQPLRITANPYWRRKHAAIPAAVFERKAVGSKVNCSACHRDAATGRFDDQAIRIPKEKSQ